MATVKLLKFDPERCTGHLGCEKACSQVHHKNDKGAECSAIRIIQIDGRYTMEVCNHCGLCIDMCPATAIKRMKNGIVSINKNLCVGCQACVAFCPRNGMRKTPELLVPFKCISCGSCVKACPEGALELVEMDVNELAEIVYHKQGAFQ